MQAQQAKWMTYNHCNEGSPNPDKSHNHPALEEVQSKDPVSIEWYRPQDDRDEDVDDEIAAVG